MYQAEKRYLWTEPVVAWGSFLILLVTYWVTVAPSVSLWDCPEYVSAATLLEIGHPPGNPVWMLTERIVTMFVPAQYAALAVNMSSGLFTALAAFFLAKTIYRVALWILLKLPRRNIPAPVGAAGAALVGALMFGWCDSVWYSAVEAEVYAMSIFMTSLCVWLMTKWAGTRRRGDSWRLLVLIAYLFGLSIGVHQLNLLCIPALAMIWAIRRGVRSSGRLILIFILSLIVVACVLAGMMPSTIALAARFELWTVNYLNWPALSGVALYVILLALSLLGALISISRSHNRFVMALGCFPAIFLSGIFIFSGHYAVGALLSALASALMVTGSNFKARRLYLAVWMLAMLLTGYSAYALIPIRGHIPSPANAAIPGNPFAFASYQSREQYGSSPLLYGSTPYSRLMFHEEIDSSGNASYRNYELEFTGAVYSLKEEGAKLKSKIRGVTPADSAENARLMSRSGDAYIVSSVKTKNVKTPELNAWLPRVTGSSPHDLLCYADWIGMDTSTMSKLRISEAVDSAGRFVTRRNADGSRQDVFGYKPTPIQHLQWLLTYQTAYMYWRYFLWNFVGRQNDRPSQGEVQHGNFITGFTGFDNLMLGAEDKLPAQAGSENKGRNRYFGLPLLLGLLGIGWLLYSRRRGMQTCGVIAILFVMTGFAITIYLNQGPAEPRERDYSFLGSYMAFAIWGGFGALMVARRFRNVAGFILPLAVCGWMCYENFDDHDRSNRHIARDFAVSMLESLQPDAILFVNGDNYTFPLWYAQEVEGVRRDVRVVNLAYLGSQVYSANLLADWRDSKALPSVLGRKDIIWDAFRFAAIPSNVRDTLPAVAALEGLRDSEDAKFPVRYVSLQLDSVTDMVYDLTNLSKRGGLTAAFSRLMMFDIIAANTESSVPRPVYWLGPLGEEGRIGLQNYTSQWTFGRRLGRMNDSAVDSLLLSEAEKFRVSVLDYGDVYMDHAPASHLSFMRGSLVANGRRLLENGRVEDAVRLADMADMRLGMNPTSYGTVSIGDSAFNVRMELGALLIDCADSLRVKSERVSPLQAAKLRARSIELKARGLIHSQKYQANIRAWEEYRNALPPRLKNKMAPVY